MNRFMLNLRSLDTGSTNSHAVSEGLRNLPFSEPRFRAQPADSFIGNIGEELKLGESDDPPVDVEVDEETGETEQG